MDKNTNGPTQLKAAALRYAAAGFAVFPCGERSKAPAISKDRGGNGFHDATTDAAVVDAWWTKYPNANIGLRPGSAGFVVLDIDEIAAAHRLAGEYGVRIEEHRPLVVSSRGWHGYFAHPNASSIIATGVFKGLDVRAGVGYVLAPPSVHPSGARYRWRGRLDEAPVLPADLYAALTPPEPDEEPPPLPATIHALHAPVDVRARAYMNKVPSGLRDGDGRKRTAYTVAKALVGTVGVPVAEAWELLREWNASNVPPLPARELRRKLDEATGQRAKAA